MKHIDMNTLKHFVLLLVTVLSVAACEKDEDKIYLSSLQSGELMATASSVKLSQENRSDIVLSLAWTKDALQISDTSLEAIDVTIQTIQSSLTEDFSGTVNESTETSLSKAYTGTELNTLANNIGATADIANTVYFRVTARTGNNMTPVYSNVVAVSITPYIIDMTLAHVLGGDKVQTGVTLYSAHSDGDYVGFMGAASWANFYLQEGDGTIWGNVGENGTAFQMSSDESMWNLWFPEPGGCYYVNANTGTKRWSALYIPSLTVSGDIAGEMTFSRSDVRWTLVFNAAQAGTATFKVSGTGSQYDYTTQTDDAAAISTPVAFAQEGENLTFGTTAGDITVTVPQAGECTLTIDLSDSKQWMATVTSGGSAEEERPYECVYLPGVDDAINAENNWTFDNSLSLYNEEDWQYVGVVNVGSQWGYQIAVEKDNWSDVYALGEGDALSGTLLFQSTNNLPAPANGLYFFNVALKALTYQLTAVGDRIYYSGLNDDWSSFTPLAATGEAGVFQGTLNVTAVSSYGFKLYLLDNWDYPYGGSDGTLYYNGNGITDDATLGVGTYTLTVNLIEGTYTIE